MTKSNEVQITAKGIKKTLNNYNPERAVAEFVWNSFDANAKTVFIRLEKRQQGFLEVLDKISIHDDGDGIPYEQLGEKFKPFMESEKSLAKNKKIRDSKLQGEEGRGRLTFFKFCESAKWETVYLRGGEKYQYEIEIHSDTLETYTPTTPKITNKPKGTSAFFSGLPHSITTDFFRKDVAQFLKTDFCWFLELNRTKKLKIELDGKTLDWHSNIADKEEFTIEHRESRTKFSVRFIRWREWLPEYSKFYFLDANDQEKFKINTTFNNKGDTFFHSVYISSDFFERLVFPDVPSEDGQIELDAKDKEPFFFLKRELNEFLKAKRKKLLRVFSDALIEGYEKEGVFPKFNNTSYDVERKKDLKEMVKALYEVEPRVFESLNIQQKKTFVGLLNVLLDSDERDRVLQLIEEIIQLDKREQDEFIALLKTTKLNRIIRTIKLIADRYKAVNCIKELVFNPNLNADEVNDLQSVIEAHYWLFGEEYHLVSAAEPNFEKALRRLIYAEKGTDEKIILKHPNKRGQMDIFAIREILHPNKQESIVVELKHPKHITLGEKELSQVKKYMNVILSDERFNGKNRIWKFVLVGNKTDDYIKRELKNNKAHGEESLIYNVDNCKIYVKTWDEIFTDFECRHNFLNKKMELEREKLKIEARNKSHVLAELETNTAKAPVEMSIP